MSKLTRHGDTELWVIPGEGWRLPVLVEWYRAENGREYGRLKPPLDCLMSVEMLKALDQHLNRYKVPAASSYVMIRYEDLHQIGERATGITPGYYLQWGTPPEGGTQTAGGVDELLVEPPDSGEGKEFCAYLHRLCGLVPYSTLRLIWKAICQYAPKFLLEERKPIELGFVKLVALPYRPNWKNIMGAKFPRSWSWIAQSEEKRKVLLETSGFTAEMYNTVLAGFNVQKGWCYWSLEAVATDHWWRCTGNHEGIKMARLGPVRYAEYWRLGIKKMLPHALGAFRQWARWNRLPCAQPDDGVIFGSRRLMVHIPKGRVLPVPPPDGPTSVVVDVDSTQLKGPESPEALSGPHRKMPEMSDLLPSPRNVRLLTGGPGTEEGLDVEESGHGGA